MTQPLPAKELWAAGRDIFSADTQGIWRSLGGVQAMKPRHTQGLRGAMSSLPIPPPSLLFPASSPAKTTASLALAWCVSSHQDYGYFLLCCNTRSDVPMENCAGH